MKKSYKLLEASESHQLTLYIDENDDDAQNGAWQGTTWTLIYRFRCWGLTTKTKFEVLKLSDEEMFGVKKNFFF